MGQLLNSFLDQRDAYLELELKVKGEALGVTGNLYFSDIHHSYVFNKVDIVPLTLQYPFKLPDTKHVPVITPLFNSSNSKIEEVRCIQNIFACELVHLH